MTPQYFDFKINKMNRFCFLLLTTLIFCSCFSLQQTASLSKYKIAKTESIQIDSNKAIICGFVRDNEKNEPLFESCIVIQNTTTGVITDLNGFFKMTLKSSDYRFIISHIGFHGITTTKIRLLPNTKTKLEIKLSAFSIKCD
jgi:hypothetical protein